MAKEKFTLQELKVQSNITSLNDQQMHEVKGGFYIVRGRVFTYRSRWTTIDIREDITPGSPDGNGPKHG